MLRAVTAAVLCGVLALSACSGKTVGAGDDDLDTGGSGGKPPSKPATSPAKKCEAYANTWCNKSFGCHSQVGRMKESDRQYNVDQCVKLIVERLPCAEIMSVSANYDSCISQINAMACTLWDVPTAEFGTILPPSTCDDALSF